MNFGIWCWKSTSLTKTEWDKYPTHWNQPNHTKSKRFQDSWMSGFKGSKLKRFFQKVCKNITIMLQGSFLFYLINNCLFFVKLLIFNVHPAVRKRQSIDELILTWNFFWPSMKIAYFQIYYKQKCFPLFNLTHFRLWSVPSGGFTKNSTNEFLKNHEN